MGEMITPIKDLPNVSFRGFPSWFSVSDYQKKVTKKLMKDHKFSTLLLDCLEDGYPLRSHVRGDGIDFTISSTPSCCALELLHSFEHSKEVTAEQIEDLLHWHNLFIEPDNHKRLMINLVHCPNVDVSWDVDDEDLPDNWYYGITHEQLAAAAGAKRMYPAWHDFVNKQTVEGRTLMYNPNTTNVVESVIFRLK